MPARYLLDTNICIYIAKHNPPQVRERFARHGRDELAMSAITWGELCHGAAKSQQPERTRMILEQLRQQIAVLELDTECAEHYGAIRAELERQGKIIGNNDLWIAAHARARALILVSNNLREFSRVADLACENWTAAD